MPPPSSVATRCPVPRPAHTAEWPTRNLRQVTRDKVCYQLPSSRSMSAGLRAFGVAVRRAAWPSGSCAGHIPASADVARQMRLHRISHPAHIFVSIVDPATVGADWLVSRETEHQAPRGQLWGPRGKHGRSREAALRSSITSSQAGISGRDFSRCQICADADAVVGPWPSLSGAVCPLDCRATGTTDAGVQSVFSGCHRHRVVVVAAIGGAANRGDSTVAWDGRRSGFAPKVSREERRCSET
jgi:hypothetical protein